MSMLPDDADAVLTGLVRDARPDPTLPPILKRRPRIPLFSVLSKLATVAAFGALAAVTRNFLSDRAKRD